VLDEDLRALKTNYLPDRTYVQIAASSTDDAPVPYQDLVTTIAAAMHAGFVDVQIDPPQRLPYRRDQCDPEPPKWSAKDAAYSDPWVLVAEGWIAIGATTREPEPARWILRDPADPEAAWRELEDDLRWMRTYYCLDDYYVRISTPTEDRDAVPGRDLRAADDAVKAAGFVIGLEEPPPQLPYVRY
jgi:hypothetical protein